MTAVEAHRRWRAGRDRLFTLAVRGSFAGLGSRTTLSLPIQLEGTERVEIGERVYVGPGCWLLTHAPGALALGSGTSIAGYCVLSAALHVDIGRDVLFARNVYVADHRHGFDRLDLPVLAQPIDDVRPVQIHDGAWLGQNVVVLPGVTIGANAVIGANSVVAVDVDAGCVAVGSPARMVRRISPARVTERALINSGH